MLNPVAGTKTVFDSSLSCFLCYSLYQSLNHPGGFGVFSQNATAENKVGRACVRACVSDMLLILTNGKPSINTLCATVYAYFNTYIVCAHKDTKVYSNVLLFLFVYVLSMFWQHNVCHVNEAQFERN